MYAHILAAVDFSEPSLEALRWTARRFPEADLTLFHALEGVRLPGYLVRTLGSASLDPKRSRELDARTNLEHLAEELGLEPRIVVRTGWPPGEAEAAAEEVGAEMIVVGAHTRRVLPWDRPGATAAQIVDEASRPVLVWRNAPRVGASQDPAVLAAVDLRAGTEGVGAIAARAARHLEARLVLLHVLPGPLQAYLRAVSTEGRTRDALHKVERAARREALGLVPEELKGELDIRTVVTRGRPVTQILAVAESECADLLVLGHSHAPSRTARALMGSVTESVLRGANAAVLTVPSAA